MALSYFKFKIYYFPFLLKFIPKSYNCFLWIFILFSGLPPFTITYAQWQPNGVAICDTIANAGVNTLPQIATDMNGGAFICWKDGRSGADTDIYMQYIFSDGTMQFPHNGVPLCNESGPQQFLRMISDKKGGAFVSWEDGRSGTNIEIYAQHINEQGKKLWDNQGKKVTEKPGLFINLASDDRGGLIVGYVCGGIHDVVVQYIDSLGSIAWGDSGVQVTNRPDVIYPGDVAVVSDGSGGAFVGWSERTGTTFDYTVFIQRVDSSGQIVFATNGIALTNNTLQNVDVNLSSDNDGGVLISWASLVSGGSTDTSWKYVQRVSSIGDFLWGPTGVRIGTVIGGGARRHTSDGEGGAYIGHGRWIQHISVDGELSWPSEGAPFTLQPSLFFNSTQARNGSKGIWNFWSQDAGGLTSVDVYGQYIDSSGNVKWETDGKPMCLVEHIQDYSKATSDDKGTAIVVWMDWRNSRTNVYASKVNAEGIITKVEDHGGMLPLEPYLEQNYPNPFNPVTKIKYTIPEGTFVRLTVFDILGNEIALLVNEKKPAGSNDIEFDGIGLPSGIYFYQLRAGSFVETKKMILLR